MKTYTKKFSVSGAPGSENRALFPHPGALEKEASAPKNDKKTPGSFFGVTLVHLSNFNVLRAIKKAAVSRWVMALCFTTGFVLAGSDGPWFPWPNFIGLLIWIYLVWAANQITRQGD